MTIPIYYEIPIFIFLILAGYTIYKLNKVKNYLSEGPLRTSFIWLVVSAIMFSLWGIDHLYHDLVPLPENLVLFFHFYISHTFLVLSMTCIAIATSKIEKAYHTMVETKLKRAKD